MSRKYPNSCIANRKNTTSRKRWSVFDNTTQKWCLYKKKKKQRKEMRDIYMLNNIYATKRKKKKGRYDKDTEGRY